MKEKIKRIIKKIFGTENNIWLKANLSCFLQEPYSASLL